MLLLCVSAGYHINSICIQIPLKKTNYLNINLSKMIEVRQYKYQ